MSAATIASPVLEMGLLARLAMFVRAFVPSMVAVTGEPPGHGVQGEAGIEFLFHSPLAWSMEVFHLHPLFGHLVPFFHAPSCAIPLRQLRDGVLLRIQQGGSEDEDRFADEVFHQPKAVCTTGGASVPLRGAISITTSSRSPWMKWSMSAPVFLSALSRTPHAVPGSRARAASVDRIQGFPRPSASASQDDCRWPKPVHRDSRTETAPPSSECPKSDGGSVACHKM